MGGKGDSGSTSVPLASSDETDDSMEMMVMMMQMMESMTNSIGDAPETPYLASSPTVETTPTINWGEKMDELKAKTKADWNADQDKRKGRMDTIHTSPLLEEEEDATAPTILGSTEKPESVTK